MLNVQLSGRSGRMALALTEALGESKTCALVAPDASSFDVFIDFSTVAGTKAALQLCLKNRKALVIGTTGIEEPLLSEITSASKTIPIVFAPNMSVGVNVLFKLAQLAAQTMGENSDIEITETHHRHKVDAPSGTALKLGQTIADAMGTDLKSRAVYAREGQTGERKEGSIGFQSVRGGDIVGEHTVMFAATGERLELVHKAGSRTNYAEGALRAAQWLTDKSPGLYDMQHVLGLNS